MAKPVTSSDPLAIRLTKYVPHKPHPPQHAFLALNGREAFYGGAAGGGKSDALLMGALQYADVPGYSALLLRKTFAQLDMADAIMSRAREWLSNTDAQWNEQKKRFTFPSGATLAFRHLQHSQDRYDFQGAAFQFVGFDELTQFEEQDYLYLFSRTRRPTGDQALASVPLRVRGASNPGGLGHKWVRSRFVRREPQASDEGEAVPRGERLFIPAKLADNPSIDARGYIEQLRELDPQTRRQLLDGDWDAREPGACFTEFVWDEHTVEGSRHPRSQFPVFRCIDFGLHHAVCEWVELQGRTALCFFELHSQGFDLHAFAQQIVEIDQEFGVQDCPAYIDPAGLGTNYQTGKKDSEVLMQYGIMVGNLDNSDRYSPETRTSLIKRLLRTGNLYFSRDECPYVVDALERAVWDKHPNGSMKDTYKKDGVWDHPLDALGEGLTRIFTPNTAAAVETIPTSVSAMQHSYSSSEFG